jgi:hypothetical protein
LSSLFWSLKSQRVGTNKEPAGSGNSGMKLVSFYQLQNHWRGGASDPGGYLDGQHRQGAGATVAPKPDSLGSAAADDQETIGLDGDFGSFLHRGVFRNVPCQRISD